MFLRRLLVKIAYQKVHKKESEDCFEGVGHSLSDQNNCKSRETRRFTDFLDAVEEQHDKRGEIRTSCILLL